ncbi:MAG: neutral/alkaline non-lysosomal ceramidase N-terminal domain-containing protein [Candidatus Heimdallarchaeota archaeon]|nr:neutral/alkaline non-lysosomal ceramidase N-terminal domain-containing protein [Candidatus Heimdallarchaeota archaeon]
MWWTTFSEVWEGNPFEEREEYGDTDKSFTLLKFVDDTGKLIGTMTFFALHPISIGITNCLISADKRGYVSRILERIFDNNPYKKNPNFIAAFPNSNGADVSPNVGKGHSLGGDEDYRRMKEIGDKIVQKTIDLINSDTEEITGDISFVQTNVDLANVRIEGTDRKICDDALGASFSGASSEDNASSVPLFVEGLTRSELLGGKSKKQP